MRLYNVTTKNLSILFMKYALLRIILYGFFWNFWKFFQLLFSLLQIFVVISKIFKLSFLRVLSFF